MEIKKLNDAERSKISCKTKIELMQAIANLTRQNTTGQYDQRLSLYRAALEKQKNRLPIVAVSTYKATPEETAAIMLFNKDKRFTITE